MAGGRVQPAAVKNLERRIYRHSMQLESTGCEAIRLQLHELGYTCGTEHRRLGSDIQKERAIGCLRLLPN
jgi:hypothetical protein